MRATGSLLTWRWNDCSNQNFNRDDNAVDEGEDVDHFSLTGQDSMQRDCEAGTWDVVFTNGLVSEGV